MNFKLQDDNVRGNILVIPETTAIYPSLGSRGMSFVGSCRLDMRYCFIPLQIYRFGPRLSSACFNLPLLIDRFIAIDYKLSHRIILHSCSFLQKNIFLKECLNMEVSIILKIYINVECFGFSLKTSITLDSLYTHKNQTKQ